MSNYNFHRDLHRAKKTEVDVANYLAEETRSSIKILNDTKEFDIVLERVGKNYVIEVKEDFMAAKTGNVAVEYECRGKPSGINVTKADVYAYVIHEGEGVRQLHLVESKVLKKAISKKMYHRTVVGGDRGSNTKMYLFTKDVFTSLGYKMKNFQ